MILLIYSSAAEMLKREKEVEKVDENLVLSQLLIL